MSLMGVVMLTGIALSRHKVSDHEWIEVLSADAQSTALRTGTVQPQDAWQPKSWAV